jgi:hypothetical protein
VNRATLSQSIPIPDGPVAHPFSPYFPPLIAQRGRMISHRIYARESIQPCRCRILRAFWRVAGAFTFFSGPSSLLNIAAQDTIANTSLEGTSLRVPRAQVCERGGFRFSVMPKRLKRIYEFGHLHSSPSVATAGLLFCARREPPAPPGDLREAAKSSSVLTW